MDERNYSYGNLDRLTQNGTTCNILGTTHITEFYYTNENLVESIFEIKTHKTGLNRRKIRIIYDNNIRLKSMILYLTKKQYR